jgi:hypothetical protein
MPGQSVEYENIGVFQSYRPDEGHQYLTGDGKVSVIQQGALTEDAPHFNTFCMREQGGRSYALT